MPPCCGDRPTAGSDSRGTWAISSNSAAPTAVSWTNPADCAGPLGGSLEMLPLLKRGEVLCSIQRMSVAPIAITGMGCICAAGRNLPDSMEAILRGERNPAPPVRFASNHPVRYPVFEAAEFEAPPDLLRTSAFGLHAVRE